MSSTTTGNKGEQFVAQFLKSLGFVVEVHPRTFRTIRTQKKVFQISQDNDFHNCFDVKAEGPEFMVYAQVKAMGANTHAHDEKKKIEQMYPHDFPYIRKQIWYVGKEWVKQPHRHKEWKIIRILELQGDTWRDMWEEKEKEEENAPE